MSKTYLCLGAGPGIGLSTAIRFAREGFRVILVSRNQERQMLLADEFARQTGKNAEMLLADVGQAAQIQKLSQELPQVDVAHFNAAVIHAQTLEGADYDNLRNDIQIGITGALYALKAFAPAMLARQSGTFLLTGGMLADNPSPQYLTLGISKAGIKNMTEALFEEFKKSKVHIASVTVATAVSPKSREASEIADQFWKIHSQQEKDWSCVEEYGG